MSKSYMATVVQVARATLQHDAPCLTLKCVSDNGQHSIQVAQNNAGPRW